MKILAIRGKNLASLAGDFAIELEQDPLAHAGLFAIVGPTGAGKSTLLDALCVALFDKTPRLAQRGGAPIGRADQPEAERLLAHDVRGLLRRGSGEGHAEVDFIGRDQRRYRARWQVRRARRRADGKFQPQELILEDLDSGRIVGGTKSETLAEIEARLGLSFEQFCRSALLAQGDFAAFLRASEDARGDLLERMTGTEIYGALSKAAHERHKREAEGLARFERMVSEHAVLSDAEREALEARLRTAEAELAAILAEIRAAEAELGWHQRRAELTRCEQEARDALAAAQAAWDAAEPLRAERVALETARDLRAVIEAADRAQAEREQARAALAASEREAGERTARRDAAIRAAEAAGLALAEARKAEETARPMLAEAERLDTEVAVAARAAAQAAEAWREADQASQQAAAERARTAAQVADLERAARQIREWLARSEHLGPVAEGWERWRSLLDRYLEADRSCGQLDRDREDLLAAQTAAAEALAEAVALCERSDRARDEARAVAEKAQRAADDSPLEAVRQDRDALTGQREALRDLSVAAAEARRAMAERERARAEVDTAQREAAEAENRALALGPAIDQAAAVTQEAERTLERLRLTLDLAAHRAELEPDQPCPLCGATEHPYAASAPAARMVDDQRSRVDELRAAHQALLDQRTETRTHGREATRRVREHAAAVAVADAAVAQARASWAVRLRVLGELALLEDPADPRTTEWVDTRLRAADQALIKLREREQQAAALQDAARRAGGLAAAREHDAAQARTDRIAAEARARAAAQAVHACERQRADQVAIMERTAQELGRAFAGDAALAMCWQGQLAADPVRFRSSWQAAVQSWQRRAAALARMDKQLDTSRMAAQHAAAAADEHAERARRAREVQGDRDRELAAHRQARAALLGGEPTAAVRERLRAAIEQREAAAQQANDRREHSAAAAASALARCNSARELLERKQAETEHCDHARDGALAGRGMSLDRVRALLAAGEDRLPRVRAALEARQHELAEAQAVCQERTRQRAAFEAESRPGRDPDQAQAAIDAGRAAQAKAGEARSELIVALRRDDDARSKQSALAGQIAEQKRKALLYANLAELIGSHNGKKFRVFAQSLTLDALLAYANTHLLDLADRYRLVRVPGHDLDLQVVDRDMGDEIRSVQSLSGGESFLVSLALALGLSSLSARDTQVESLLIDEGFGSLDPVTLDVALSVLDALQASGRKVGLISHVPGLAERIGVCITVRPQGGGRSVVGVLGG